MNNSFLKRKLKGYSLIELAIVITIVSVLFSGALSVATNTANQIKVKKTYNNLEEINKALQQYVKVNGVLPCPASPAHIKSTSENYGIANGCTSTSGVYEFGTNHSYGMVPVVTLGLPVEMGEDSYGNKIIYVVDKRLTQQSSFNEIINTSLTIASSVSDDYNEDQIYATDAVYVLLSMGANAAGAFGVNSSAINSITGDGFEDDNYLVADAYDERFYKSVNNMNDTFDDILVYGTRNEVVVNSGAYEAFKCAGADAPSYSYDDIVFHTWPDAGYNQVVPSNEACPDGWQETVKYPTKRCGAFGKWEGQAHEMVNPCTYSSNYEEPPAEPTAGTLDCTGGITDESAVANYRIHTFKSSGSLVCTGDGAIEYLIVGGGGGGGGVLDNEGGGGGGGGGGVTNGSHNVVGGETITITVGAAGTGGAGGGANNGGTGGASFFGGYASATGGVGGSYGGNQNGNGGAGGAGTYNGNVFDPGGINGGSVNDHAKDHMAGAGGGSMENTGGGSTNHDGGAGAAGTVSNITGISITYGSGGGGGAGGGKSLGAVGAAGAGSGGTGADDDNPPSTGDKNKGGGGGGGAEDNTNGAAGGSGVVIVRYLLSGTGGTGGSCSGGSQTTSGGNTIHTFTSSGSFICSDAVNVSYLVVGGGGGGGGTIPIDGHGGAGGGGGGGVSEGTYSMSAAESLTISVGNGGNGGAGANGSSGGTSSISGGLLVTSTGGSGGTLGPDQIGDKDNNTVNDPPNGGASGAGDTSSRAGGLGWDRGHQHGSGGGGSSMASAGGDVEPTGNDHQGGAGGAGTSSSISGTSVTYGSGGGGGAGGGKDEGPAGAGGTDSGGDGGDANTAPSDGTKGGGGGGASTDSYTTGGKGGKGIVIFSYTTP